jgi:hypothetical protein
MKFGKYKFSLPLDIKYGPRYHIELSAMITVPEITIENFAETLDFGKVLLG